jgi:hypothetical protein
MKSGSSSNSGFSEMAALDAMNEDVVVSRASEAALDGLANRLKNPTFDDMLDISCEIRQRSYKQAVEDNDVFSSILSIFPGSDTS